MVVIIIMIMVHEWQTDVMIELWLCLYVDERGCVSRPVWAIIGDFRKIISYTPHARAMAVALSVLIKTNFCWISCVYSSIFFNIYYSIHRNIIFIQLLWELRFFQAQKSTLSIKPGSKNVRSPPQESMGQNENTCGEHGGCVRFVLSENRFATVAQWPRISFATS